MTWRQAERCQKGIRHLGVDIDEMLPVEGLPVGYKQFIEIAREIDKENVKLLVFDEPTAVLTEMEADLFLKAVEKLSASGIAILFITHRLSEVMQVADNITVIRDGEVVGRLTREEATIEDMARMMVGRKIDRIEKAKKIHNGSQENILEIRNLRVRYAGELVKM